MNEEDDRAHQSAAQQLKARHAQGKKVKKSLATRCAEGRAGAVPEGSTG